MVLAFAEFAFFQMGFSNLSFYAFNIFFIVLCISLNVESSGNSVSVIIFLCVISTGANDVFTSHNLVSTFRV